MVYANKVSTVSSTYANEITTEEYGEGLHNLLRARQNDLLGIVNGISYIDWDPNTDQSIYQNYTAKTVHKKKAENKKKLEKEAVKVKGKYKKSKNMVLQVVKPEAFTICKTAGIRFQV